MQQSAMQQAQQVQPHNDRNASTTGQQTDKWTVQASWGAMNTRNPIREIIETMDLAENPNKKVIPLSIGDPTIFGNLKPCKEVVDALQRANAAGKFYGYQTAAGMETAREAVAVYHSRSTGTTTKPQDVILASGCSHALDLSICALARQGQNILIPRPGFPLYKTLTSVYGVQYKQYNLLADQNWSIDLAHLESIIDENTAAIVINNPSNPCGSVFSRKHLLQILELAEKYRKPIISDEIYDKLVFSSHLYGRKSRSNRSNMSSQDSISASNTKLSKASSQKSNTPSGDTENRQLDSLLSRSTTSSDDQSYDSQLDEMSINTSSSELEDVTDDDEENDGENGELSKDEFSYTPFRSLASLTKTVPILTCGGISKTCLIPGLRLGWVVITDPAGVFDASVRNGLNRLTQRLMGPNSLVQGALPDILARVPQSFYTKTMDFIFTNAKLCYDRLSRIEGLKPHMPQGSMYLMVRFDAKRFPSIDGDLDFTSKLMNEESVLVLPGKCFDFPNYFRICLTVPTNVMEEALERMRLFCDRHREARELSSTMETVTQYPLHLARPLVSSHEKLSSGWPSYNRRSGSLQDHRQQHRQQQIQPQQAVVGQAQSQQQQSQ